MLVDCFFPHDLMSIHMKNKFVHRKRNHLYEQLVICNNVENTFSSSQKSAFFKLMGFHSVGGINGFKILSVRASSLPLLALALNNLEYTY